MIRAKKSRIQPLPYPVYFLTVLVLAVGGLLNSIYLAVSHYRVYTDIGYRSFCAISQSINCDTVSQSPFSIFLNLPIPIWGILGYLLFLLILPFAWGPQSKKIRIWSLMFLVSLAFSLYSVFLAWISTFKIHSYCMMCILSYGISFMLLFYTGMIRRRFGKEGVLDGLRLDIRFMMQRKHKVIGIFAPFFLAVFLILIFFPAYWSFEAPPLAAYIPHGIDKDGHPWIGADNPVVEIVEFTDYQCFQCNKMHYFLRQIMVSHPGKLRLIHRHFPMDHEFNPMVKQPLHVGSGKLALLTLYAATKNKFWQLSDLLFAIARTKNAINIEELAKATGLDPKELSSALSDPKIRNRLQTDIRDALNFGVSGTPSFVIDGRVYKGQIPAEIIKKIID
jgi:protein-disulfide isomerase/uncharacterized membrane protein